MRTKAKTKKKPKEELEKVELLQDDIQEAESLESSDISVTENPVTPEIWQGYDLRQAVLDNDELSMEIDDTDLDFALTLQSSSPAEIRKKQAELLKERRQQVRSILDGHKLQQAIKIIQSTDNLSDVLADPDIIKRVATNIKDAKDYKFLTEALLLQAKMINTLTRLDTVDSEGTAKRINIGVQYKGADGSSTSVIVQAPTE